LSLLCGHSKEEYVLNLKLVAAPYICLEGDGESDRRYGSRRNAPGRRVFCGGANMFERSFEFMVMDGRFRVYASPKREATCPMAKKWWQLETTTCLPAEMR